MQKTLRDKARDNRSIRSRNARKPPRRAGRTGTAASARAEARAQQQRNDDDEDEFENDADAGDRDDEDEDEEAGEDRHGAVIELSDDEDDEQLDIIELSDSRGNSRLSGYDPGEVIEISDEDSDRDEDREQVEKWSLGRIPRPRNLDPALMRAMAHSIRADAANGEVNWGLTEDEGEEGDLPVVRRPIRTYLGARSMRSESEQDLQDGADEEDEEDGVGLASQSGMSGGEADDDSDQPLPPRRTYQRSQSRVVVSDEEDDEDQPSDQPRPPRRRYQRSQSRMVVSDEEEDAMDVD
ncbi:hypothetical protein L227DRAFT_617899 [Lentinus tigrinus ALCF2SS1-6]|uniref:Uncharacterized protein n=1 Tax=Lentinus tigrinus ALCF2SS1-6 TaxID=1328759 RepID=A0A5C2RQ70_9APHY|nr:hypothetical protein L227DRAFT_617899 [Lentinus tigrinus ALCF2SS1-6]